MKQIDEGTLMASDMPPGKSVTNGDNFSVCIDFDSTEEQAKCFAAMSEGGEVTMLLQETFWGAKFGMLHDKFGVRWMFNCHLPKK
jgi:PhnB protein